jgi:ribosomal protein S18 acetylase RimI-like enzyme
VTGPVVRRARPGDEEAVLALFDRAVAWLVSQGRTGQWGERPWSEVPRRRALVDGYCASGDAWFAEVAGEPVGFLALGDALDHVPAAGVPEVYVRALVTSREAAARGAGRALLDHACRMAAERGLEQVRVDCYAGSDGRLVAFYESCGFVRTGSFTVGGDWPGALLVRSPG